MLFADFYFAILEERSKITFAMNHTFFSYPAEAGFFQPWRGVMHAASRWLFVPNRYYECMRKAAALDQAGLTQDALAVYQRAVFLRPRFPNAHIQVAMASIKLRRFEEAQQAIGFARNYVRSKPQRFALLLLEAHMAYENFRQNKDVRTASICHHLANCLLDLDPLHPFPLHFKVVIHLELAYDKQSFEVRRAWELEKAEIAMRRYLHSAAQFEPSLRKYHARFAPELKAYIQAMPEEAQAAWLPMLDELRLLALLAEKNQPFTTSSLTTMKNFFKKISVSLIALAMVLTTVLSDGIFIMDCIDVI